MPIKSYLAHALPNQYEAMLTSLSAMAQVEAFPAENAHVAIVITDTADGAAEKALERQLENNRHIQCLALVFGHEVKEQPSC